MNPLNLDSTKEFVNQNIDLFHKARLQSLEKLKLKKLLLRKNPYLFKASYVVTAEELVRDFLNAYLSSSDEKFFGNFLEELVIFVAKQTCNGRKSAATGIDLEFENEGRHYLVSIKSGSNWGNSSQQKKQSDDFKTAVRVLKQSNQMLNVEPVMGICYGKTRTIYSPRGYLKVVGQSFWYLISKNKDLYTDIIEPIGYRADEHVLKFVKQKEQVINKFAKQLDKDFCDNGIINWKKLVEFNSGNM